MAGVISASGAGRALLHLGQATLVQLVISEQVVAETERNLARKAPQALPAYRLLIREVHPRIVKDPSAELVRRSSDVVVHRADVPVLLAAMQSGAEYLVTLNRRHFIDDPEVAKRAALLIGTPGDALAWLRGRLTEI